MAQLEKNFATVEFFCRYSNTPRRTSQGRTLKKKVPLGKSKFLGGGIGRGWVAIGALQARF